MSEKPSENNIEKPKILYHGSSHKNIEELELKRKSHWDENKSSFVFTNPDIATTSIFMPESENQRRGVNIKNYDIPPK